MLKHDFTTPSVKGTSIKKLEGTKYQSKSSKKNKLTLSNPMKSYIFKKPFKQKFTRYAKIKYNNAPSKKVQKPKLEIWLEVMVTAKENTISLETE